jgi:hypothetical protein
MVHQKIQKYTSRVSWGTAEGPTVVPHGGRKACGTVAPPTAVPHGGRRPVSFKKFVI